MNGGQPQVERRKTRGMAKTLSGPLRPSPEPSRSACALTPGPPLSLCGGAGRSGFWRSRNRDFSNGVVVFQSPRPGCKIESIIPRATPLGAPANMVAAPWRHSRYANSFLATRTLAFAFKIFSNGYEAGAGPKSEVGTKPFCSGPRHGMARPASNFQVATTPGLRGGPAWVRRPGPPRIRARPRPRRLLPTYWLDL